MIQLFFKMYTFFYISYLKIVYHKQIEIKGKVKAKRFFRIEISRSSQLKIEGDIDIKENLLIAVRKNAKLTIGKNCFFNRNCSIIVRKNISIGSECMFGENIKMYDHNHLISSQGASRKEYDSQSLVIGNNCWIGNDVNIFMGSEIKERSIIGAMSLVNKKLSETGIYLGVPVRLHKKI